MARYASGNGLLTQAPPNTGAGWYTLATGAWPGVHGSTNNTFHINGQPFAQPHGGVRPGRAAGRDRSPSPPSAAGPKVAQVEWAGGAQRHHQRPDDRLPVVLLRPWRRDELHRRQLDVAVRRRHVHRRPSASSSTIPPATPARRRSRARRRPTATGWTGALPATFSPADGDAPARPRLRRRQVRPQRLHLRQHQRRHDRTTTRVLFSAHEGRRPTRSAPLQAASWPTSRSRSSAARSTARRPACSSRSRS